jgi:hypothetical protein
MEEVHKTKVGIIHPRVLKSYIWHVCDVDHHDWLVGKDENVVRGKKRYWALVNA